MNEDDERDRKAKKREERNAHYRATAPIIADRALNGTDLPPQLRAYYAAMALWMDSR